MFVFLLFGRVENCAEKEREYAPSLAYVQLVENRKSEENSVKILGRLKNDFLAVGSILIALRERQVI